MSASTSSFVHLHVHTHYSLLDGATRIDALVHRAKQLGMPAVAITDHGNLFGAIEFYRAAKKAGVKPIVGIEAYLAPVHRSLKRSGEAIRGTVATVVSAAGAASSAFSLSQADGGRRRADAPAVPIQVDRRTRTTGAGKPTSVADGGEPTIFSSVNSDGEGTLLDAVTGTARGHHAPVEVEPTVRGEGKESYHLLLLAMNLGGYRNLLRLATIGYTEGFYRKPRIDKEVLREYSAGLICTSTCIGGEIPQVFLTKDGRAAEEIAKTYLDIFGPDRFFIELQDHGIPEQRMLNPELVHMARRLGVGVIASNDVHYLDHDDHAAHDVLCCINTGSLLAQPDRFKFPTDQFYFKTFEEMAGLFPDHLEALANTKLLADMCNVELDLTKRYAPVYRVPLSVADAAGKTLSDAAYLRDLVYKGAHERYGDLSAELRQRIDFELDVITRKGFASYFLIVWDCVQYARSQGIPISARGSGCSSVVGYSLYISTPDPIRYGLYFERFMDPDRDEMPDIDLDICQNGRQQIIEYIRQKYGHVAQIITFGTLKARAAVKDVARVMGLGFNEANNLTRLIPAELNMTLDKALEREPELKKQYVADIRTRTVLDVARRLEGLARNAGVHAAGVVIADQPLTDFLPLYKSADQDGLITQFDGPTVEKVGLLKMDFLGLRTLTILERARQLAERAAGEPIDLDRIDLSDAKVYELFARGQTKGIFQFESGGMRDVIMRMRPNRIQDLIAANALYRPGPMEYISEYIARKHGQAWNTPHPIMTEVLQETYGIMVYQEQVSRMVNRLGGIELKAAFRLAKAISKKNKEMIASMHAPFIEGCVKNGVRAETAEQIFEDILKFGGYAFNKAHSTGYALVAYQTAWMKTHFPVEFMAALMTFELADIEKVAEYREECMEMGINIKPPDINTSNFDFVAERTMLSPSQGDSQVPPSQGGIQGGSSTASRVASARADVPALTGSVSLFSDSNDPPHPATPVPHRLRAGGTTDNPPAIRFGLGAIKGVGERAVASIVQEREHSGPYKDLFDFCERVDLAALNRATVEALICAGAFDSTGAMRRALVEALDGALSAGQERQRDRRVGQLGLFGAVQAAPTLPRLTNAEWTEAEMLAREKAVLGFFITKHPLASYEKLLLACSTASTVDLARRQDGDPVVLGGMISNVRTVTARTGRNSGKRLGVVTLEDLRGRIEAVVFPDDLSKYRSILVPDRIVFLDGVVDRKREEPALRVSRVILHDRAVEELAKALLIDIDSDAPIDELTDALKTHRGSCPVYLNVRTNDRYIAQVECNPGLRVTCTDVLLDSLVAMLGRLAVHVLGPGRHELPIPAQPV